MIEFIVTFCSTDRKRTREQTFHAGDIDIALDMALIAVSVIPDEFVAGIRQADVDGIDEYADTDLRRIAAWLAEDVDNDEAQGAASDLLRIADRRREE